MDYIMLIFGFVLLLFAITLWVDLYYFYNPKDKDKEIKNEN